MNARVYLSDEAADEAAALDPVQRRKLDWWARRLSADVTAGDHVRRELVPAALRRKYALENLWRLELPGGWRALYTILSSPERGRAVRILRVVDHRAYDRLFGYKRS